MITPTHSRVQRLNAREVVSGRVRNRRPGALIDVISILHES
jgi:hypothetical protein